MSDRWFIHKDPCDDLLYVEVPAYTDTKRYFTFPLELHSPTNPFSQRRVLLLRRLIGWIPKLGREDGREPFVLMHPDFGIQNFIVSEEGELLGIIDWDGVAAVPRSFGNERYPGWLTRDWDLIIYGWVKSMEEGVKPDGLWEDSPATLTYYRGIYEGLMAKHRAAAASLDSDGRAMNFCRMSLITDNLAIAARNLVSRDDILRKMVKEIMAAAGRGINMKAEDEQGEEEDEGEEEEEDKEGHAEEEEDEQDEEDDAGEDGEDEEEEDEEMKQLLEQVAEEPMLTDVADRFLKNKVDAELMETLKAGFDVLLSKEGL